MEKESKSPTLTILDSNSFFVNGSASILDKVE